MRELLRAGRRRVHKVVVAEGSEENASLSEIIGLARAAGAPLRWVERPALDAAAKTDSPQGVIATADPIPAADIDAVVGGGGKERRPFVVVLDGVTDPHNLGAVMRSALCAGATGLVVGRHRAAGITPATVKAAAGAVEYLPVATVGGIPNALSALSASGLWTVGLDAGTATTLWELTVATEPVALVLGAEGRGLSRLARDRCDLVVSVPLSGPLESLNVSAAATLACFEVARRRTTQTN